MPGSGTNVEHKPAKDEALARAAAAAGQSGPVANGDDAYLRHQMEH